MISQITPDIVTTLVSSLGVVGALVWYLYHNTTNTIPTLTRQHCETMEKISGEFTMNLKEERKQRQTELELLKGWIKTEAACKFNESAEANRRG
jgi:hypothetical protein